MPHIRPRFVGGLEGDDIALSDDGDIITPVSPADNGAGVDWLVAAAPGSTDLAALGRIIPRQASPPALILSALAVDGAAHHDRESVARALSGACDVTARHGGSCAHVKAIVGSPVEAVPDPLVLAPRLTAPDVLRSRLEYLRVMDGYPHVETLLVEVSNAETGHLKSVGSCVKAAIARGYRLVAVAVPADGEVMTEDLRRSVARAIEPSHCLDRLSLDDRLAAIASAAAIVPISASLLVTACAFGRPCWRSSPRAWDDVLDDAPATVHALVHDDLEAALQTPANPSAADSWRERVDGHFDRTAERLSRQGSRKARPTLVPVSRVTRLEDAQRITGRRLADERLRFAERAEGMRAEIELMRQDAARRAATEAALRHEMADALAHARLEVARADASRRAVESRNERLLHDVAALERDKADAAAALERLQAAATALECDKAQTAGALARVSNESAAHADAIAALRRETADKREYIAALTRERDELLAAVRRFERSRSWRYLAPARAVAQLLRRWLRTRP
jgi:hypothetical protein